MDAQFWFSQEFVVSLPLACAVHKGRTDDHRPALAGLSYRNTLLDVSYPVYNWKTVTKHNLPKHTKKTASSIRSNAEVCQKETRGKKT